MLACWLLAALGKAHADTTVAFKATIGPGTLEARCGFYTMRYTAWCSMPAITYLTPHTGCNPTQVAAGQNCPQAPSLSQYSCTTAVPTCDKTLPPPSTVDLCVVVYNPGSTPITCDVSITGSTVPVAKAAQSSGWPVWKIAVVTIGATIGLVLLTLLVAFWLFNWCSWNGATVSPQDLDPEEAEMAKITNAGRMIVPQVLPPRFPRQFYPAITPDPLMPLKPAIMPRKFPPYPEPDHGCCAGQDMGPPPLFYSQHYPPQLLGDQPKKIPRP